MTANQVAYHEMMEKRRTNQANEVIKSEANRIESLQAKTQAQAQDLKERQFKYERLKDAYNIFDTYVSRGLGTLTKMGSLGLKVIGGE